MHQQHFLVNQKTHRRTSISNVLTKIWKMENAGSLPPPPPRAYWTPPPPNALYKVVDVHASIYGNASMCWLTVLQVHPPAPDCVHWFSNTSLALPLSTTGASPQSPWTVYPSRPSPLAFVP